MTGNNLALRLAASLSILLLTAPPSLTAAEPDELISTIKSVDKKARGPPCC